MINISTITTALVTLLEADASILAWINPVDKIGRGNYVNVDPNRAPWVGVYRSNVKYEPRTLGAGNTINNWEGYPSIRVLIQAQSYVNGEDVEDKLEGYVQDVIDAVLADPTIGGTVDMVNDIDVNYGYSETESETIYFQTAIVTFDLEVRTS